MSPIRLVVLVLLFVALLAPAALAQESSERAGSQIVNDSVYVKYGAHTAGWIAEQDMFFGDLYHYTPIDTTIINYHYWTYTQRLNNLYKDLGNVGTALYSIFPRQQPIAGATTGFDAYSPYFDTQDPVYYNTRSPYTKLQVVWAGNGRALSDIKFTRNVNPRWNVGVDFRPILVDKQIQRQRKGDRQTTSYYYDIYTSYRTANGRYQINFNFRHIGHRVVENGGVVPSEQQSNSYLAIFAPNNQPRLTTAGSDDIRNMLHFYHQYVVIPQQVEVYHRLDAGEVTNDYHDSNVAAPAAEIYDAADPLELGANRRSVQNKSMFRYVTNEVGTKGRLGRFFHDAYFKVRAYDFAYRYLTASDRLALPLASTEYYLGGVATYAIDSLTRVQASAEFLLEKGYRASAELQSKWVDAKVSSVSSLPPFVYNAYKGEFDSWNNRFKNRNMLQAEAFAKARFARGWIWVSPGVSFTAIENYIYFLKGTFENTAQTVLPMQSAGRQLLLSPEARVAIKLPLHFTLKARAIYSTLLQNDDYALRIPTLFVNAQLAYENHWFKKHFHVQFGVDMHWKSSYYDLGYDPIIQQFYVQNETISPSFFLTDIFFNGQIGNGRFFLRYHNIIQAFTNSGYLSTPSYYPGQRSIFDFGIEILLFD